MCQLSVYFRKDASETELEALERFKEYMNDRGLITIEVTTQIERDREHQRLTNEGWRLSSTGSGVLQAFSLYTKDLLDGG